MLITSSKRRKDMAVITISRDFASGGRKLGRMIAKRLDYQYVDKYLFQKIAEDRMSRKEHWNLLRRVENTEFLTFSPECSVRVILSELWDTIKVLSKSRNIKSA
jgi:hypothetical protein